MSDSAEHDSGRTRKQNIHTIMLGLVATLATLAGGGTFYIATDPEARPDAYTATMAEHDLAELDRRLTEAVDAKTEFNRARWDEISQNMKTQFAIIESLRLSVEGVVRQCAEFGVMHSSVRRQLDDQINERRRYRQMLWDHINGHQINANMGGD